MSVEGLVGRVIQSGCRCDTFQALSRFYRAEFDESSSVSLVSPVAGDESCCGLVSGSPILSPQAGLQKPASYFTALGMFIPDTCPTVLSPSELAEALFSLQYHYAALDRAGRADEAQGASVLLFTAYSSDYSIGQLCEHVNRRYAHRHGYRFESEVLPYSEMLNMVQPRQFLGWYKVLMLNRYLNERREQLVADGVSWLVWIDADAVVIDHDKTLQQLLSRAAGRELCIGEDASTCCLINTGVLAVRICDWSAELWNEVWEQRRYFTTFFYEQSALVKCLRRRHEGLERLSPFHSHVSGGPSHDKLFPHTCVFPMSSINSNVESPGARHSCEFIFHALGRSNKLGLLYEAIQSRGLGGDATLPHVETFKLVRGKCSGPPSEAMLEQSQLWGKQQQQQREKDKEFTLEKHLNN